MFKQDLLTIVKKHKLKWYGVTVNRTFQNNIARHSTGEGEVDREEDGKVTCLSDWTGLKLSETLRMTENREELRELVIMWRPNSQQDYGIDI